MHGMSASVQERILYRRGYCIEEDIVSFRDDIASHFPPTTLPRPSSKCSHRLPDICGISLAKFRWPPLFYILKNRFWPSIAEITIIHLIHHALPVRWKVIQQIEAFIGK